MPLTLKDLDWLKSFAPKESPEFGQKMSELVLQLTGGVNNIEQQGNFNVGGNPTAPNAPNAMNVTARNGYASVAITDQDPSLYRGVSYFVEHADNPQFTNSKTEELGATRNLHSLFIGNTTRYFRAYKAYSPTAPSQAVYHGSAGVPKAVSGGGIVGPPHEMQSQGSGTGAQGQGLQGPGTLPYRGTSTKPPIR